MSRKNLARARSNGVETKMNLAPPEDRSTEEPEEAQASGVHRQITDQRGQPREGDILRGYTQVVSRYPLTSLVASFSVGFGLGVLATAIFPRAPKGWLERHHLPDSREEISAGIRRIPERIAQHLPGSFYPR